MELGQASIGPSSITRCHNDQSGRVRRCIYGVTVRSRCNGSRTTLSTYSQSGVGDGVFAQRNRGLRVDCLLDRNALYTSGSVDVSITQFLVWSSALVYQSARSLLGGGESVHHETSFRFPSPETMLSLDQRYCRGNPCKNENEIDNENCKPWCKSCIECYFCLVLNIPGRFVQLVLPVD